MTFRTRFAPSPTGPLHLGHAFSALIGFRLAEQAGGTFLLRIEDIDTARSRLEWEAGIFNDLRWLSMSWPVPVLRQSERMPAYRAALQRLETMGLLYPCRCTRADIRAALSAPHGPDAPVYPGTCRGRSMAEAADGDALRLDLSKALTLLAEPPAFIDAGPLHPGRHHADPAALIAGTGDIVLGRRDGAVAYHLAVVVDDAFQGINQVTRGDDLFAATPVQVVVQNLLELPTPTYWHHELILDTAGKRLAKRDDARSIAAYRKAGLAPADIRSMIGL